MAYMLAPCALQGQQAAVAEQADEGIPGYVLSWQGDSIRGHIIPGDAFKNQHHIGFIDEKGVRVTYHPDRIAGYGYGDSVRYLSRPTPYLYAGLFAESHVFLKNLENGPASLYRFYSRRSAFTLKKGPGYFELVQKPDGSWHEVSLIFGWKRTAQVFAEYPALAAKIRNKEFRPEQMQEVIRLYNLWYRQQSAR
ncbi:MAG: hypothetical protein D6730_07660 [Bacteroidetes bacterium]|nr:MAG: hypothetical protein D6730_07660 [Bacteroidota bacterium]